MILIIMYYYCGFMIYIIISIIITPIYNTKTSTTTNHNILKLFKLKLNVSKS